jgi:hypothetical protein
VIVGHDRRDDGHDQADDEKDDGDPASAAVAVAAAQIAGFPKVVLPISRARERRTNPGGLEAFRLYDRAFVWPDKS